MMNYIEYILVGLAVLAAAVYACWRLRRAFAGKDACSCAFRGDARPPCAECEGDCGNKKDPAEG